MGNYRILLEPDSEYHIYNHAVGWDNLFREEKNYRFFLDKLIPRISPFADVLAYCLMPNHFHLVIRIKEKKVLLNLWGEKMKLMKQKRLNKNSEQTADHFLLDRLMTIEFGSFFNSYVQAYNKIPGYSTSEKNRLYLLKKFYSYLKALKIIFNFMISFPALNPK